MPNSGIPTVSMGPRRSWLIYPARFNEFYLNDRGIKIPKGKKYGPSIGDGECGRPEHSVRLAWPRGKTRANLIFVVNCNSSASTARFAGKQNHPMNSKSIFKRCRMERHQKSFWGSEMGRTLPKTPTGFCAQDAMNEVSMPVPEIPIDCRAATFAALPR